MSEFLHGEITRQIIGAAFEVWKVLGKVGLLLNFGEQKCEHKRLVM